MCLNFLLKFYSHPAAIMPPNLQMRKQSLVPGKSHVASHKQSRVWTRDGGGETGEAEGGHTASRLEAWFMCDTRAMTTLGSLSMVEKNQFWQVIVKVTEAPRLPLKLSSEWRPRWDPKLKQSLLG